MADDDGEEWGVNAELQPEPGTFLAEWHSGKGAPPRAARPRAAARSPPPRADWKDDTKKKRVSVFVNLEGVTVTGVIVAQDRGPRILVFKKKRRKNYRRRRGHRQYETTVQITSVG